MDIPWKKALGNPPNNECLALTKTGEAQIGFLREEDDSSWTCSTPSYGDFNEKLRNVCWYIAMSELLATVPKDAL